MPAGDLLPTSGDSFALELRLFLAADDGYGGALWWITDVAGFGDIAVRDQDVKADAANGAVGGSDYISEQPLVFTLASHTGSAAEAEAAYRLLRTAFLPGGDEWLHLWAPDWGHVKLEGRARGSVAKRKYQAQGVMFAQATFLALDPEIVVL